MKKRQILLVSLIFLFNCKSSSLRNNKIVKHGYLFYSRGTETSFTDLNNSLSQLYDDTDTKLDSVFVKALFEKAKNVKNDLSKKPEVVKYFILGDTIKIQDYNEETIFIPKTLEKYTLRKFRNKIYKNQLNWLDLYKRWDTKYEIETFKNEKKKILNIEGYKIKITEKSIRSYDTYEHISEIYINDNYNIPLNYYNFLEIKEQNFDMRGLIIHCKSYYKESPELNNVYTLKDYNFKRQPHSLIEINFEEYQKQNL